MPQLQPGTSFGKYQIVAAIGRGGMAEVYKAYDPSLDRHVALKVLADHLLGDPEFVRRFQEEARIAANLEHLGILPIHEVGEAQPGTLGPGFVIFAAAKIPFIAMRLVEGSTLADHSAHQSLVFPGAALSYLRQVADALDFAHANGIVHRDVKPHNILVDRRGRAYLMDFGIARAGDQISGAPDGLLMGTPEYMSPEQILRKPVGPEADRYALGVVAYELFAGRPPFQGSRAEIFHGHVYETPPPLRSLRPSLPPGIEAVVDRMLDKMPDRRWTSGASFVHNLAASARESGRPTNQKRQAPLRERKPSHPPFPRPWVPAIAAMAAVLLLISIVATRPNESDFDSEIVADPLTAAALSDSAGAGSAPATVPTPTADQAWVELDAELARAWGHDWEGTLALLVEFDKKYPGYPAQGEKTYSALVGWAGVALAQGDKDEGARRLGLARGLGTGRGEASATLTALTPTPAAGDVLLSDDFESSTRGRLPDSSAESDNYRRGYFAGGEYGLEVVNPNWGFIPSAFLPGSYVNASIAIDARVLTAGVGFPTLACRHDAGSHYRFNVDPSDGTFFLSRFDNGNEVGLVGWRAASAIRRGTQSNRIELWCVGSTISGRVNGVQVASVTDRTYTTGQMWIAVSKFSGPTRPQARFDNLVVTQR